jgi:transposase
MLLYLPPYSPDLNPIEESFSTWKAYLRRQGRSLQDDEDPILMLLESVGCITADMAVNWIHHAGYIVDD